MRTGTRDVAHVQAVVDHYRQQLSSVVRDRPWVVATPVLISASILGKQLLDLGASRVFAIGSVRGTGRMAQHEHMSTTALDCQTDSDMMASTHQSLQALMQLPSAVREAIDAFDPSQDARVIEAIFGAGAPVGGRSVFGARSASWQALEDKLIIDNLWDRVGIPRAPSMVAFADADTLTAAHRSLDRGSGTMWAADNRDGWHGGATGLRHVRGAHDLAASIAFFRRRAERVRVMPFLEGIPCSIHGWVFPSETVSFRPCEMLVYRNTDSTRLTYAGAATAWSPPAAAAHALQDTAHRVGEYLRQSVGYRGSFTIDGVMTASGFLPTELNPRFGAALDRLASGAPALPLYLLHLATAEGLPLDYQPLLLQQLLRSDQLMRPVVRGMLMLEGHPAETTRELNLQRSEKGWRPVDPEGAPDATLSHGPSAAGSLIFATVHARAVERGPSSAPDVLELLQFAGRHWGLPVPNMTCARDVCGEDV